DFEKKFEELQTELQFTPSLDELDSCFFLRDCIEEQGYVSSSLSRQICARMAKTLGSWNEYFSALLFTNHPQTHEESAQLSEDVKKDLNKHRSIILAFTSKHTLLGLKKESEKEFIEHIHTYFTDSLRPFALDVLETFNAYWNTKAKSEISDEEENPLI
ncbi:MAG: hypothetical protein ACI8Y7_000713, partial [Candidatus Woesearchaeota archaeon]